MIDMFDLAKSSSTGTLYLIFLLKKINISVYFSFKTNVIICELQHYQYLGLLVCFLVSP